MKKLRLTKTLPKDSYHMIANCLNYLNILNCLNYLHLCNVGSNPGEDNIASCIIQHNIHLKIRFENLKWKSQ